MGIRVEKIKDSNSTTPVILVVQIDKKLTPEDYAIFVNHVEPFTRLGKTRILLELIDFYGWTAGILWHETEFATKHFNNIERVAVVGDKYWAKGAYAFCKPFIASIVRYYDSENSIDSKNWICEGCEPSD